MGTSLGTRPDVIERTTKARASRPRSEQKRQVILEAATEAFLGNGYSRTSMDEIARLARVSKQTVYMHFGDKERLLFEIVMAIISTASNPFDDEIVKLGDSVNLQADLRDHARKQVTLVLQPRPMQLRRLVIAEAVTFPELGRAFYENGPGRTIGELTKAFQRLNDRGLLTVTDPARAASDFNWLIMSDPLNHAMLLGKNEPPDEDSINEWADQAVSTFLAAYGPTPSRKPRRKSPT
jgi:TetR/AcrR family transcriptional regulator, mexJK operon transcriptional repressor